MKKVRFLNLSIKDQKEKDDIHLIFENIMNHGIFLNGPEVKEFEEKLSNFCQREYCSGVSSGSDALFLALKALEIKEEDEVITTSLSWIATANSIRRVGATPFFADIGDDLNIDTNSIEKLITPKTKAIIFVNFTGQICDVDSIMSIAKKHNLFTIEDAAQSFGAYYKNRPSGSFGDISCLSMNPMKIFNSFGEAGAILSNNKELIDRVNILKQNGMINREVCTEYGINSRLDTIQSAVLMYRLKHIDIKLQKRAEVASKYNKLLENIVEIPIQNNNCKHTFYSYTIRCKKRDELKNYLEKHGIETQIQHKYLMSEQPIFKKYISDNTKAKDIVKTILSIPANENTTDDEVQYISNKIKAFYEL